MEFALRARLATAMAHARAAAAESRSAGGSGGERGEAGNEAGPVAAAAATGSALLALALALDAAPLAVALAADWLDAAAVGEAAAAFGALEAHAGALAASLRGERRALLRLLAMCVALLRRLSKAEHAVLAGRVLLFLAHVYPLADRSGLNTKGELNAANVTRFEDEAEFNQHAVEAGRTTDPAASADERDKASDNADGGDDDSDENGGQDNDRSSSKGEKRDDDNDDDDDDDDEGRGARRSPKSDDASRAKQDVATPIEEDNDDDDDGDDLDGNDRKSGRANVTDDRLTIAADDRPIDYQFYKTFWSLQEQLRDPALVLESDEAWQSFEAGLETVMAALATQRGDEDEEVSACVVFLCYLVVALTASDARHSRLAMATTKLCFPNT